MKNLFSQKSFKVLISVVSLLLVLIIVTAGNSSVGTYIVNFITLPMQQVSAETVSSAEKATSPPKSTDELQAEISSLEDENRKLRDMLVDYYDVKSQNEQFKKYYAIKEENPEYNILPATVIRRDPNENFYGFTIDKGSVDGIEKHDPVITENGLIGWVSEVDATSCKVQTILSPDTQVGVIASKTSDSGIVTGSSKYSDENLVIMTKVSAQHTIKKGDIVTTSGLGGIFPKQIRIGEVQEVKLDEYDSLPLIVIKPYEDIRNITSAAVITDYPDKGTISKSESSTESKNESTVTSSATQ